MSKEIHMVRLSPNGKMMPCNTMGDYTRVLTDEFRMRDLLSEGKKPWKYNEKHIDEFHIGRLRLTKPQKDNIDNIPKKVRKKIIRILSGGK